MFSSSRACVVSAEAKNDASTSVHEAQSSPLTLKPPSLDSLPKASEWAGGTKMRRFHDNRQSPVLEAVGKGKEWGQDTVTHGAVLTVLHY